MSKNLIIVFFILLLSTTTHKGQNEVSGIRTGFIPALAYDADLGLKYGGIVNVFDYGKGDIYPDYHQYLYLRIINSTKNTFQFQALLESNKIIKNTNSLIEVSYLQDQTFDFYGFNGYETVYMPKYTDMSSSRFIINSFYNYFRKHFRFRYDLHKNLNTKNKLLLGLTFNHFLIHNSSKQSSGIKESGLYEKYVEWGVINEREAKGGDLLTWKLGWLYDTRNEKSYCTSGRWFESLILYSPGMFHNKQYSKLILTYRHYHSFRNEKITLSGRISTQNKLSGEIPFYMLNRFYDSRMDQDGLGGMFTIRGVYRNRVVANGYALANIELKYTFSGLNFKNTEFKVGSGLFFDTGLITQRYDVNKSLVPDNYQNLFKQTNREKFYTGIGPSLYLIISGNNVITINYGIPLDDQLGMGALYIGSRMLF